MKNLHSFFRGVMIFGAASVLAAAPATGSLPAAARALDSIPAWFEPNQGLHGGEVKYYSRGAGYTVFLEESGAVLSLVNETAPASLRIALVGGNPEAGCRSGGATGVAHRLLSGQPAQRLEAERPSLRARPLPEQLSGHRHGLFRLRQTARIRLCGVPRRASLPHPAPLRRG